MATRLTTETFIQRAKLIHGDKFDYSESVYTNCHSPILVGCRIHGLFNTTSNKHLCKRHPTGCPSCARKCITTEETIRKCIITHGYRYDYSNVKYVNDKTKIEIVCRLHGSFMQMPYHHHTFKQGCPECKLELSRSNPNKIGYYCDEFFTNFPEKRIAQAIIYYIRLFNEVESFYKVGITTTPIQSRMYGIPYKYELLEEVQLTLHRAFVVEQFIKSNADRYAPHQHFCGHTECFASPLSSTLINYVESSP